MDADSYTTDRLKLIPFTPQVLQALLLGPESFFQTTAFHLPIPYTEFPDSFTHTLKTLLTGEIIMPWTSYAIIHTSSSTYIGQCGFKSQPDKTGEVECGYEIAPAFRLQGYAQEAIQGLLAIAFRTPVVRAVIAHTLAFKNESNHLLVKNGFLFLGSVEEEGEQIWKWILPQKVYWLKRLF